MTSSPLKVFITEAHTHAVGVPLGERIGLELELEFVRQVKRDIRGNHDQLSLSFKGLQCTSILNPFELFPSPH